MIHLVTWKLINQKHVVELNICKRCHTVLCSVMSANVTYLLSRATHVYLIYTPEQLRVRNLAQQPRRSSWFSWDFNSIQISSLMPESLSYQIPSSHTSPVVYKLHRAHHPQYTCTPLLMLMMFIYLFTVMLL